LLSRLALLTLLALAATLAGPAGAQDTLFTVTKLSVDATAGDAVTAKQMAMADAQQQGLRAVVKRLVPYSAYGRIPTLPAETVEAMVDSVSVRREQTSTTRYIATLDVSFYPQAVRQLLRSHQLPYLDRQGPQVQVLPIVIEDGTLKSEGTEGWREAWSDLDLEHSLTPGRLTQLRPTLTLETLKGILAGDEAGFDLLRNEYGGGNLLLVVASAGTDGTLITRLYGMDAAGDINYGRADKVYGGDVRAAAQRAAKIAQGVLEGRWKATQIEVAAADSGRPIEAGVNRFALQVEFTGLKDWQNIRARLMNVSGLQGLETSALSPRGAFVSFYFPGDSQRLASVLAQDGFLLEESGGAHRLRSRY
jgi:hypothetical protein